METFERKETKYLLTFNQYSRFMELAGLHLAPAEYPEGDVTSLYYDTPDFTMVNRSLEKPRYKEKLRVRSYGVATDSSEVFVEVKKKFKGIVYKRRVNCTLAAARAFLGGMSYEEAIERWPLADAEAREACHSFKSRQVAGEIAWMRDHYEGLMPQMLVSTHRTSYIGADDPELRVTFDAGVCWELAGLQDDASCGRGAFGGHAMFGNDGIILEVKCADAIPLWLLDIMNACSIRPQSVSKYGRAYLEAAALGLASPAAPQPAWTPAAVPAEEPVVTPSAAAVRKSATATPAHRKLHFSLSHIFARHAVA